MADECDGTSKPEKQRERVSWSGYFAPPQAFSWDQGQVDGDADLRSQLSDAIEEHVLDELVSNHGRVDRERSQARSQALQGLHTILLSALLESRPDVFRSLVDRLSASAIPILEICENLIMPMVAELGRRWSSDTESFVTIAVAMSRLQRLVTELTIARQSRFSTNPPRTALFARMPENEHTIGLAVISACFAENGWGVAGGADLQAGDRANSLLHDIPCHLFGLSVGCGCDMDSVKDVMDEARQSTRRDPLCICIGGPGLRGREGEFLALGADFEASDLRQSLKMADSLVH
ncbi:cobalamin B12-binding domain-containing protein [Roseibium aquae]|nr:cobalamin B12-binding domain-containing protein [Roseibium aquae]